MPWGREDAVEPKGVPLNKEVDVFPGDRLRVVDDNGTELLINGQDDPSLLELAKAVDSFFIAQQTHQYGFAEHKLRLCFNTLPHRVKSKLPGMVSGKLL